MRTSARLFVRGTALLVLLVAIALPVVTAIAQERPAWIDRGLQNIAHRGGAIEFPENTPFAYAASLRLGADVLEMDTYETADGELVVIHDSTVDRTTGGSGDVSTFTVAQLKELDAAYWFVPGTGTTRDQPDDAYVYRGIATGDRPVPADLAALGVTPNDFRIPTLRELLERFAGEQLLVELKPDEGSTGSYEATLAELLAEFGRTDDVLVASFLDHHLRLFKALAPDVTTSPATVEVAVSWATSQQLGPGLTVGHAAFSVPPALGVEVITPGFVADAHANGMAVYAWTINGCDEMVRLLELGVDGIMTDAPSVMEGLLAQNVGEWDCTTAAAPTPSPEPQPSPELVPVPEQATLPATGGGLVLAAGVALAVARTVARRRLRPR